MDWSTIVNELITADSGPITELQSQVTANQAKITALTGIGTDLTNLQTAVEALGDFPTNVFAERTASMVDSGSTWSPTAGSSTPAGTYSVDVSTLASAAQLNGAEGISAALSSTSDVSGLTLSTLNVATPPTAGEFTVDGDQVSVSLSDSLQDVFTAISTATGGNVTAAYDPTTDEVSLTSANGSPIVLGAANDTSNMLQALKLGNNGTSTTTSSSALGSVSQTATLADAGLKGGFGSVDSSGNGSFSINGVAIDYNINTDTMTTIAEKITNAGAGVTAQYDEQADRMVLTNTSTGDVGISASDTTGSLLSSLGLTTTATLQRGTNTTFSVNGGPTRTSMSTGLTTTDLGVAGLSLTVNSTGTNSISVQPDVTDMTTAINGFITAYNQLQSDITTDTAITPESDGTVKTSTLSGDYEVEDWGNNLRDLVFNALPGVAGDITSLDDMGIGFASSDNVLSITDQATLTNALTNDTTSVASFFQSGSAGFVYAVNGYLSSTVVDNTDITDDLQSSNTDLNNQISILQVHIQQQQSQLTQEFTEMEDAVQTSQNESTTLGDAFSSSSSNSTTSQTSANSGGGSSSASASSSSS